MFLCFYQDRTRRVNEEKIKLLERLRLRTFTSPCAIALNFDFWAGSFYRYYLARACLASKVCNQRYATVLCLRYRNFHIIYRENDF